MPTTEDNRDNGALHTGALRASIGDQIQIEGEAGPRRVTYTMGSQNKGWHACFKGQGAVPLGRVVWEHLASAGLSHVAKKAGVIPKTVTPPREKRSDASGARASKFTRCNPALPANKQAPIDADVIIHADWSGDAEEATRRLKRQYVRAERRNSKSYSVVAPKAVTDAEVWLADLVAEARGGKAVLVGFDFVIGIPKAYAKLVDRNSFIDFVKNVPAPFFEINSDIRDVSTTRPFFPRNEQCWRSVNASKGQRRLAVAQQIGVDNEHALLRRCEHATQMRGAGSPLFITSSAKQVGRATLFGWKEAIVPALRNARDVVRVWPFDGDLRDLVCPGSLTIVETYPTETYAHLGVGGQSAKQNQNWRREAAAQMLEVVSDSVGPSSDLKALIDDGFGGAETGEDPFDALAGALGMVLVAMGRDSADVPDDDIIRKVEGWILGLGGSVPEIANKS